MPVFACPECRSTFETFDALQAHRLDPYGRKARGEQKKDGRFPTHQLDLPNDVAITMNDAAGILAEALRARGASLDDFNALKRAEALAGTIAVIEAMLVLGWTIKRPLSG